MLIEKNTNERAIVRILVPKRTMTMSELNAEENKREEEDKEATSPQKTAEDATKAPLPKQIHMVEGAK